MSIFELYLLTLIPKINTVAWFVSACFFVFYVCVPIIMLIILTFPYMEDEYDKAKQIIKSKIIVKLFILSSLTAILVPSEEDLYLIIGGSYATNIEGIEELPENVVKAANDFLETYTKGGE